MESFVLSETLKVGLATDARRMTEFNILTVSISSI